MKTILVRIRSLRNQKGITQLLMSAELGISQPSYNKIENGQQKLDCVLLIKIADLLETSVGYLVGEKKSKKRKKNIVIQI